MKNYRNLGPVQQGVLRALLEHNDGTWPGGWTWENRSRTVKVLDSLVERGLVDKVANGVDWVEYRVNNRGRSLAQLVGARNWRKAGEPR